MGLQEPNVAPTSLTPTFPLFEMSHASLQQLIQGKLEANKLGEASLDDYDNVDLLDKSTQINGENVNVNAILPRISS